MYSYRNTVRHSRPLASVTGPAVPQNLGIMASNEFPVEKVSKIWKVLKQIIEIILAALGGLAAGATANAAGLTGFLSSL